MAALPSGTTAWGHKVTAHIYTAGPPTDESLDRIADAINAAAPEATFMGLAVEDVQDEPRDEVGA